MKPIKFFTKIKLVFDIIYALLTGTPVIFWFVIIRMLKNSLRAFREEAFIETMRRFKILICILFYSIKTIFIKNHKNDTKLCYLIRKMHKVKRK
jgi:hypothetical protein